ncbi:MULTISPECIES: chromate transporter [Virgibacillus]|uniref:Chromate transporter n=1 Tax=Virgibacillus pantothenticus TaxID=1473 RepID=A0A0L0QLX8_VIRPA|nr:MULTISPECIES: chromate transporter [Virgibacillus]API93354.1 chromate transporter [Virgibacillus sp. 6R]KNE19625.1 chromate transporter [Virgibacillus pantothenticus]MBS7428592.1 chromate transporter [Virgibacillus sp. 19R1-5]MED3736675.1 chromate transporter [Virgibacillus pantothenticus]QTY14846.1 chromate transporter [Virgibacillus pantothenticus]
MKLQWNIFIAFFRVGILGYGGGPSSIPLVHKEVVDKYKWMSDEEFGDLLALGNTLPGPIATKLAGYIGYRVSGVLGMLNAVLATTLPTIFLMILLLSSLSSIKGYDWVQGMTAAVIPVVGVMLAVLTWQFIQKAGKGMGWLSTIIMLIAVFILLEILHLHPGILIGALLILAIIKKDGKKEEAPLSERDGDSS